MNWDQIENKWAEMTRRVQAHWCPRDGADAPIDQHRSAASVLDVVRLDEKIVVAVTSPTEAQMAE